jgi:NADH-quinone oxidoreductase subunit M
MSLLPWTLVLSLAGALLTLAAGRRSARAARWVALAAAAGAWGVTLLAAGRFVPRAEMQILVDLPWIPSIGARFQLGADGISLTLLVLTGLVATAGVLFSWNVTERTGEFFALFLTLVAGVYGVFLSADALVFFIFYEIAIVPKYFLIAIWGSTNREYGAMKLALYSFAGSALVLAGLLWVYAVGGGHGFGFAELARAAATLSRHQQIAAFGLVFFGFATLAGIFPLHTWAPTGHVAAPTAASMLLAGVVMKLGAYGCLRVALPLSPLGFAAWQTPIAWLAAIGIVYAGLVALVQEDLKFVIGYSSVSHMGFVLLGLAAANTRAVSGAVLQMFSHGVIAGLLFAVVGRMIYDRTHTRQFSDLRGMPLRQRLPFAAAVFVVAGMASMGLPGFSGFPAEWLILIGTWRAAPAWAAVAVVGVLVAAAFTLRAIQLTFFAPAGPPAAAPAGHAAGSLPSLPPITLAEKAGALLLVGATLTVGLRPDLLLNWIVPALQSPLLQSALQGGRP